MTQYAIFLHYEDADSEAFGPFNSHTTASEAFKELLGDENSGISSDTIISLEPLQRPTPAALKAAIARHPEDGDEGHAMDQDDELQEAEVDDDGAFAREVLLLIDSGASPTDTQRLRRLPAGQQWGLIGVLRLRADGSDIACQDTMSGRWRPLGDPYWDRCVIHVPWRHNDSP